MSPRNQTEDTAEFATAQGEVGGSDGDARLGRLEAAVSRLRSRRSGIDIDRAQLIVGAVLFVVGILFIVMGWYGASHTPYLFEQIPYVISGGLLGLALVFAGAFVYFAYWIARMMRESRDQADRAASLLAQIQDVLEPSTNGQVVASRGPSRVSKRPSRAPFVATVKGTMFHLDGCQVVAGRTGLRRVMGAEKGMEACRLCDPLGADQV